VVKLIVPGEEEELTAGATATLYWETYDIKRPMNKAILKYIKNGGKTWKMILPAPDTFDPMACYWDTPDLPKIKKRCRVKVILKSASGNKAGAAFSEGFFTIKPP
jgi:hypothetical protein